MVFVQQSAGRYDFLCFFFLILHSDTRRQYPPSDIRDLSKIWMGRSHAESSRYVHCGRWDFDVFDCHGIVGNSSSFLVYYSVK